MTQVYRDDTRDSSASYGRDRNLTILTDAEKRALYDLPDFDEFQRAEFFSLTAEELALALRRDGISAQLLLQLGYFKAKQAFFTFTLGEVPEEDINFSNEAILPWEIVLRQADASS